MFESIKTASRGKASVLVVAHFSGEGLSTETKAVDADGSIAKAAKRADATGELEQERHDFAINTMAFLFAEVVTVDVALQFWSPASLSA